MESLGAAGWHVRPKGGHVPTYAIFSSLSGSESQVRSRPWPAARPAVHHTTRRSISASLPRGSVARSNLLGCAVEEDAQRERSAAILGTALDTLGVTDLLKSNENLCPPKIRSALGDCESELVIGPLRLGAPARSGHNRRRCVLVPRQSANGRRLSVGFL